MSAWTELFREYLAKTGMKPLQFSLKHRIAPSKVHYWLLGSMPRRGTRERIERLTKGEVPCDPPHASAPPPKAA